MNIFQVSKQSLYIVIGIIFWVRVLKSGVYGTLAGVGLAFSILIISNDTHGNAFCMEKEIEHGLY